MRIYFMGICGTAMGNTALLMRALGHEVSGADAGAYPPMSEVLAAAGIEVMQGYDAGRLERLAPDRVIIGNAMSRGNPEVEWLLETNRIPYASLPAIYHDEILKDRLPVVITGTHGKTTTATMTAYLLERAGLQPGWMIGGVPKDLAAGTELGRGRPFVVEGDEYDSAFFDKRSKFIHYRPRIAVINNVEFDHADIFRDLEDVQRSFRHFLRLLPAGGTALVNGDDASVAALLPAPWTEVVRVGTGSDNDLRIVDFAAGSGGASFALHWQGQPWARVDWSLHGLFNARNAAMAALAAALAAGHRNPRDFDLEPLNVFGGVRRRQDVLAERDGWIVLEDFAHHPTAIAGALDALRAAYPGRSLIACVEPRSNTMRRRVLQSALSAALARADKAYLGCVHRSEQLEASERMDPAATVGGLDGGQAFESNGALKARVLEDLRNGRGGLVVFFTNGGFDGVPREVAAHLTGLA